MLDTRDWLKRHGETLPLYLESGSVPPIGFPDMRISPTPGNTKGCPVVPLGLSAACRSIGYCSLGLDRERSAGDGKQAQQEGEKTGEQRPGDGRVIRRTARQ